MKIHYWQLKKLQKCYKLDANVKKDISQMIKKILKVVIDMISLKLNLHLN